ncbi:origin recognition complex subunit 6-domain-containing protein [Clohesyomyces aquaticus]|uniref:Origin recognition complex subunit 6-domain-containing protein n=1 Tax=Clohesyomyces aquaticus TaxID=1231657 RepID=A0A1Y1Z8J3_9PLEO|nr:origin recognition complex subunit 6-domain-containing protein [Clohesyomyces aquaticus]
MNRESIEQALTGLIPALNGPLPPELTDLALSLLARSRSVANSLKPDEEIARTYACAQLACERLKKRLNLPTITSRPPCPPRIYKKLYKYLESALPESTSRAPETPRKSAAQPSASARTTPKTPLNARKTPRSTAKVNGQSQEAPEWAMPTIRTLAKAFSYANAAPHVYTGVESTLPLLARMTAATPPETPSKRPRRSSAMALAPISDLSDTRVFALIAVMLLYVLSRLSPQEITPEQFDEWRDKAVSTILQCKAAHSIAEDELVTDIDDLMPLAQEEGWLRMEWFLNVVPAEDGDEMEGVKMTGGSAPALSGQGKSLKDGGSEYIGLGTMMQDATDYLSERQRADYKVWKARILSRIQEIEAT